MKTLAASGLLAFLLFGIENVHAAPTVECGAPATTEKITALRTKISSFETLEGIADKEGADLRKALADGKLIEEWEKKFRDTAEASFMAAGGEMAEAKEVFKVLEVALKLKPAEAESAQEGVKITKLDDKIKAIDVQALLAKVDSPAQMGTVVESFTKDLHEVNMKAQESLSRDNDKISGPYKKGYSNKSKNTYVAIQIAYADAKKEHFKRLRENLEEVYTGIVFVCRDLAQKAKAATPAK